MEDFEDMPTVKDAAKKLDLVKCASERLLCGNLADCLDFARSMDDKIPGMDVSLMAHQLIGVDW